jgi:hypothetical protein
MTKLCTLFAAFAALLPVAYFLLSQAAKIVA